MRQDQLTHTLTVRVPPSLRQALAAEAERAGVSSSEFVRRMVRTGIGEGLAENSNGPSGRMALAG